MAVPLSKAAAGAATRTKLRKPSNLAAIDGGGEHDAGRELAKLLALDKLDPPLTITGASLIGDGADAAAFLTLSDDSEMRFRSLREMTVANKLMAEVVATTGAMPKLNQQAAMRAVSLLKRYAVHVQSMSEDDEAIEWGVNFLHAAETLDVDIDAQAERWAAFTKLSEVDPRRKHAETRESIASASVVLRCADGSQLVRTDWFRAYVRSIEPRMTPAQIATLMQHVGWIRRGYKGRWKATRPGLPGQLSLAFWLVPDNWEDRGDALFDKTPANGAAVPPGVKDPPVRAPAHTRVGGDTRGHRSGDRAPAPGDFGPERDDGSLADARPAQRCRCERPLPAPDDGEVRCARCGHRCGGWGGAA